MIQIQRVEVGEILDLRYDVLRAGLPRSAANFPGDSEPTTVHIAAKESGKVIGCATVLLNHWNGEAACQLRGMAIDPVRQRAGIGAQILAEVQGVAREKGVKLVWANARKPAAEFYRKHGWEIVSGEFEIPTAGPHYKMIWNVDK
jgi:N-acetylglutamate synthase-like GNAT family acetyltransferase